MRVSRGGDGGPDPPHPPPPPPMENLKNIGFLSNTSPNSLKNYKATKPAFHVGPSSAHQRNAIKMAFRWRANDGPLLVLIGSSLPLSPHKKNHCQSWTSSGKSFFIPPCVVKCISYCLHTYNTTKI